MEFVDAPDLQKHLEKFGRFDGNSIVRFPFFYKNDCR